MPMPLTPSNPSAALVDLNLSAVALCGEGANSRAHILLTKRKENEIMPTSYEDLLKALTPEQAKLITEHVAGIEAAKDGVIKGLNTKITDLSGENETLKKSKPQDPLAEDILKGATPELRAMMEKMQTTISTLVTEREETLAKERFEKVKALPVKEDELKAVLKAASPAMMSVLESAAKAVEELTKAKGTDAGGEMNTGKTADEAYGKLEKAAKELAVEKGITFEKAFTEVCTRDSETYKKYTEGVR